MTPPTSRYGIADGYRAREEPEHHVDIGFADEYQDEVYERARDLMVAEGLRTVLDIGCGSAFKLIKHLDEFETTGTETEPCLSFLRSTYPTRRWVESGEPERSFRPSGAAAYDLVICSDVIEHIVEPDTLLAYIKSIDSKFLLISTPDREVLSTNPQWGAPRLGPPLNPAHVREWTFDEFRRYLGGHFQVLESAHCRTQIECQYHLCRRRPA